VTTHVRPVAVRIRSAIPEDLDAVRGVFRRSSLSVEPFKEALLADPGVLELSDRGVAEGRTRVAVWTDGAIVGFITSASLGGAELELEDLFVDPDWMGQGVARRLVGDLVAEARRAGITSITVTANPYAEPFYRRMGFVRSHEVDTRFGPAPCMRLRVPD
jgi:GNAT superfamily N-acetyltransferase